MEACYRGWIPTVTGRLSFSHFGDSRGIRSVRRSDSQKRYLVAYQNRKTGDSIIPSWIQRVFGVESRAHFVCVAETVDVQEGNSTDAQGALVGRVFIIDHYCLWKRIKNTSIYACFKLLADYDQNSDKTIEAHFSNAYEDLIKKCEKRCSFQAKFRILRTGIADFTVDPQMRTRPNAPSYDGPNQKRLRFSLAHQAYAFLKDLGHHHKHHSKRNDTITDLYDYDGADDRSWRRKTLYGVYRRIITAMRREDITQQIQSVGLLAYAKAFKEIWLETYPEDETNKLIPIFYDGPMQQSIGAAEVRMRFATQQRSDQQSVFRTILFSGVGLILSIAGLVKISEHTHIQTDASPLLITLAALLLQYPLQIMGPAFAIFYFWFIAWPRFFKPQRSRTLKAIQALAQPFRRSWAIISFWILAAAIFAAGVEVIRGGIW